MNSLDANDLKTLKRFHALKADSCLELLESAREILSEEQSLRDLKVKFFSSNYEDELAESVGDLREFLGSSEPKILPQLIYYPIKSSDSFLGYLKLEFDSLVDQKFEYEGEDLFLALDYLAAKLLSFRLSENSRKEKELQELLDAICSELRGFIELEKVFELVLEEIARNLDLEYSLALKGDYVAHEFILGFDNGLKRFLGFEKRELFQNSIKSFLQYDLGDSYVLCVFNTTREKAWEKYELEFLQRLSERLGLIVAHGNLYSSELDHYEQKIEDLKAQNKELKEIGDAKTQLINTVSHELRTPLVSIMGFSNVLLRHEPNRDLVKESCEQILKSGQRLSRMVDDFIVLNRADSSGWKIKLEPLDIGEMARFVVEEFAPLNTKHEFDFSFPEDYPMVEADRKLLRQVLDNLIMNAIKYSPSGGLVTLSIDLSESGKLAFSVSDQGLGITESEIGRIFDRFYRVKSPETEAISGMGLGLAISKDIISALNGEISGRSNIGKGSTFCIELPLFA